MRGTPSGLSRSGDLHIIGVGNGDPSSHEADKGEDSVAERHLFNGHAQVIVQAGGEAGDVSFHGVGGWVAAGRDGYYRRSFRGCRIRCWGGNRLETMEGALT
jgi:hypothetical protein